MIQNRLYTLKACPSEEADTVRALLFAGEEK